MSSPLSNANIVATEGQLGQDSKQAFAGLLGAMSGQEVFVKGARINIGSAGADVAPTSWRSAEAGGAPSLSAMRERRTARMAAGTDQSPTIPDDYVPGSRKVLNKRNGALKPKGPSYAQSSEERAAAILKKRGYEISKPRTPAEVQGGLGGLPQSPVENPAKQTPRPPTPPKPPVEQGGNKVAVVSFEDVLSDIEIPEPESTPGGVKEAASEAPVNWQRRFALADPVSLAMLLLKQFRAKWIEWEPETLWSEIQTRYGFDPHRGLRDRIMALRVMTATERFHREWSVFEKVVVVLHGRDLTTERVQDISLAEIARVLTWARKIQQREFSSEVLAYIAAAAHEEGLLCLPPPLDAAQSFLDGLNRGGKELCAEVWRRWSLLKDGDLTTILEGEGDADAVDVQIARMASVTEAARNPNG